jgi:hypothetical protein
MIRTIHSMSSQVHAGVCQQEKLAQIGTHLAGGDMLRHASVQSISLKGEA